MATATALAIAIMLQPSVAASGHGPVFGAATPTLGKGGWQFDQAWMGQHMDGSDDAQILRSMIGVGLTERIQVSVSLPVQLMDGGFPPAGRMMSMMSFNRDIEALAGWRFHTRPVGQGARFESTVFAGGTVPLVSEVAGLVTAPAAYIGLTSGYASRAHYFWAGVSHQHATERSDDRLGHVSSFSLVYGYRPPAWRLDYPKPDLRLFVEAVGDSTSSARHAGQPMPNTGGRVMLVGPSTLLLYKAYGLEAGILFPVYQHLDGTQPSERFRFAVNFTYFFWPASPKGH